MFLFVHKKLVLMQLMDSCSVASATQAHTAIFKFSRFPMSEIPGFAPQERRAVEAAMIYRYGQLVPLEEADVEVRLTPGSDALTSVPGIYWNERNVQFVVCKLAAKRYRSYFFYTEDQQYRIGEQDYDVIEDCVRNLLQLQVDHDVKRRAIMSNPGLGPDEDYHGPIVV